MKTFKILILLFLSLSFSLFPFQSTEAKSGPNDALKTSLQLSLCQDACKLAFIECKENAGDEEYVLPWNVSEEFTDLDRVKREPKSRGNIEDGAISTEELPGADGCLQNYETCIEACNS